MEHKLESRPVKVSELKAVEDILDSYLFSFSVRLEPDANGSGGTLIIGGDEFAPRALSPHQMEVHGIDYDADPYEEPAWSLLDELGDEGVTDLIRSLTPYLLGPLVVVWYYLDEGLFWEAKQWTAWPDSPHVQFQSIYALS